MSEAAIRATASKQKPFAQRMLDGIEMLGNKIPHSVLMFLYLIVTVIVLSQILALAGVSVTEQITEPAPYPVQHNYPFWSLPVAHLKTVTIARPNTRAAHSRPRVHGVLAWVAPDGTRRGRWLGTSGLSWDGERIMRE